MSFRAVWVPLLLLVSLLGGCVGVTDQSANAPAKRMAGQGGAASSATSLGSVPLPTNLVWKQLRPAPTPRAEHAAAVLDGKIYSIGGYFINNNIDGVALGPGAVVSLASVEVYDIKTDTWTTGPDYPVTLNHEAAAALDGYVYVFYGTSSYKLNIAKQVWEKIAPMSAVTAAADPVNGKIYVAGSGGQAAVYDPKTDSYEKLPNYPTPRSHVASGFVQGKYYIGNGDKGGHADNTAQTEQYDPPLGDWRDVAPNPVIRGSTVGTEWYGRFVVLGGQNQTTGLDKGDMIGFGQAAYPDVHAYDPATDTWTKLPDMPHGRHGFGAVTWEGKIYGVEGAPQEGVSGFAELIVLQPAG